MRTSSQKNRCVAQAIGRRSRYIVQGSALAKGHTHTRIRLKEGTSKYFQWMPTSLCPGASTPIQKSGSQKAGGPIRISASHGIWLAGIRMLSVSLISGSGSARGAENQQKQQNQQKPCQNQQKSTTR